MNKGLQKQVKAMYRDSSVVNHGFMEEQAVHRFIDTACVQMGDSQAQQLWSLLVLETWFRVILDGSHTSAPNYTLSELVHG